MSWLQWLNLAFQVLGAVEQMAAEIAAKQPFTTPPIFATLEGTKYSITVTGTPAP